MRWEIEGTDQFEAWYNGLTPQQESAVIAAIEMLEELGPALPRPFADTIKGSRHHNMKELRPRFDHLRIFFAFDPRRMAILLIGGDKKDRWRAFYDEMIPIADDLYDEHLATLGKEGLIP